MAAARDGRIITGFDVTVGVWRDGACERTIQAHRTNAGALGGNARRSALVSASHDHTVKRLWTLDGALERTFTVGTPVLRVAAMPDDVHFVVGLGRGTNEGDLGLYHVDGTLVYTFAGHPGAVHAVAVTPDGQHIISGSYDKTVKVWSVATKSLVSTCVGHTECILAVAAMPDNQRILNGGSNPTVHPTTPSACGASTAPSRISSSCTSTK